MNVASFTEVRRFFEYDNVYVDVVFLVLWVVMLLRRRERSALLFGLIIAPLIYLVDAGIWWNATTIMGGATVHVREYWIGGVALPHPLGQWSLTKFGLDFMMTISYALYTFPWLWIAFSSIPTRELRRLLVPTVWWAVSWLLVPALSMFISLDERNVVAVRHMGGQYWIWICATAIGYALLLWRHKKDLRTPLLVFLVGAFGGLFMEAPLMLVGIREPSFGFLLFEMAFLINQAVPFLFLIHGVVTRPPRNGVRA